jgi:hypothetical protein
LSGKVNDLFESAFDTDILLNQEIEKMAASDSQGFINGIPVGDPFLH